MLWSRWLSDEADFAVFQREFQRRSGNPVDPHYLRGSRVRGYFTNAGEMLAGYVVRTARPLRYFDWLTEDERQARTDDLVTADDFVEITCIWMKAGRIHPFERGQVYLESIAFAILSGKPAILGGTFVERVQRVQSTVMRQPFREGISAFRGEQTSYWLYYGRRSSMIPSLIRQMVLFSRDAGRRHRRGLIRRLFPRLPRYAAGRGEKFVGGADKKV